MSDVKSIKFNFNKINTDSLTNNNPIIDPVKKILPKYVAEKFDISSFDDEIFEYEKKEKISLDFLTDEVNQLKSVGAEIFDFCESKVEVADERISKIKKWWSNQKDEWIDDVNRNVLDNLKKAGATIGVGITSLTEGVLQFGESIVDLFALTGASILTVPLGIGNLILKQFKGKELPLKELWDKTNCFVSEHHVTNLFDKFYKTEIGNTLKDNSYNFDII